MFKCTENSANWIRHFEDVGSETMRPRSLPKLIKTVLNVLILLVMTTLLGKLFRLSIFYLTSMKFIHPIRLSLNFFINTYKSHIVLLTALDNIPFLLSQLPQQCIYGYGYTRFNR